ncbi:unnamed protein product [Adineta ricciae]|uniref:Protein CASC3 n=1 Tax=Adineta ricciae TaxID=249248 RepID=A0A816AD88_ADIRI|nr:unnamed protein product [Adineta ricciae]
MSDPNQICENLTNPQEEEVTSLNDASKIITISNHQEDDSEYEDLDDDDDESLLNTVMKKALVKKTTDNDELDINIKPRRSHEKHLDDEHSEDENDNQSVPNLKSDEMKKKKSVDDDDNNTQSPAYIPRKGRFYEHDDRTLNDTGRSKKETSRNDHRFYTDGDGKWQHDLYFRDEQKSAFRSPAQKNDYERIRHDYHSKNRFHTNDFVYKNHENFQQQQGQQRYQNDYRQRVPQRNTQKPVNNRTNQFNLKDYHQSLPSHNRQNLKKETPLTSGQQRYDHGPSQIDQRIFRRRRSLPDTDINQKDNDSRFKDSFNRNNQKVFNANSPHHSQKQFELFDNKPNLPPRLQKPSYPPRTSLNLSPDVSTTERPKRYSNMRNNFSSSGQQPIVPSQVHPYREQRTNKTEQNDWPQAPPPPTSYLPRQIITPQMFYQQYNSRSNPMVSAQTSMSQQVMINTL